MGDKNIKINLGLWIFIIVIVLTLFISFSIWFFYQSSFDNAVLICQNNSNNNDTLCMTLPLG
ncbi:MAG: hypothetical protein WC796_04605 [Candidatus Pacearchaeota archaeon]|jgi:hypothetical protein